MGEAYIDYDDGINQLKVGRQRLATPLINDHDLRLLPSSYEAAVFRNRSLPKTLLEVGYVTRYSGFSSKLSNFDDQDEKWGADGLAYLYAETTLSDISVKAQYIDALDNSGIFSDYSYADARFPLALGQKSFISVQYGGTGYQSGTSGHMYGVKAGTSIGSWDLAVLYNAITDNSFLAVESGPMYSDWQQGYGNYEPSDAYGVQVSYHPSPGWSLKTGFVDVQADEDDGYLRDIFTETYIDTSYKLNDYSNVRLRYSIKNQASNSTREDRNDFRIIYYISF